MIEARLTLPRRGFTLDAALALPERVRAYRPDQSSALLPAAEPRAILRYQRWCSPTCSSSHKASAR